MGVPWELGYAPSVGTVRAKGPPSQKSQDLGKPCPRKGLTWVS